jgi:hypothetical protein
MLLQSLKTEAPAAALTALVTAMEVVPAAWDSRDGRQLFCRQCSPSGLLSSLSAWHHQLQLPESLQQQQQPAPVLLLLMRHWQGMFVQTFKKEASGATCCACSSAARSWQQQWQRMMRISQPGKSWMSWLCLALPQQPSSAASNMQKQ